MGLKHSTTKSFGYAFQGLKTAFLKEPNFRIHIFFAISALIVAGLLGLAPFEWIILTFTIFWVISLELLNTVLEALVNLVSPEVQPYAKTAKDVAAACVLMSAILSIMVGLILFVPKMAILLSQH